MNRRVRAHRGWTLGALLLCGACCSNSDCGIDPSTRPFGERIVPFFHRIVDLPHTIAKEFETRDDLLGDDFGKLGKGIARDTRRTGVHLANLPGALGDEVVDRASMLVDDTRFWGNRLAEDSCCFLVRAWHAIKLLE